MEQNSNGKKFIFTQSLSTSANFAYFSVISDSGKASENPSGVKRIIFCSGRVYYDLIKARREKGLEGEIAISTIEQVSFNHLTCSMELSL